MLSNIIANFQNYVGGYSYKTEIDNLAQKNMDAYSASVFNQTYLPTYSAREQTKDWQDRLNRAKNGYMNFPQKIIDVYQNAIFRTGGEPTRETNSKTIQRFMDNCDGAGTTLGEYVRNRIFILTQIQGGALVIVDKPQSPDSDTFTKRDQALSSFFPYAYLKKWKDVVNFGVDRHSRLDWIMFGEDYLTDKGETSTRYRYFDKMLWSVLDKEGKPFPGGGEHKLGVVPVVQTYHKRRADHNFLTPRGAIDDVVRLTLKIFEYQSQLEQMIVNHAFMKIAMPKGMWNALQEGMGNKNAFVYPDGTGEDRAYYIESNMSEIDKMIDLVYDKPPNKILYFATLRDKVAMPREESGIAKFIDSSDETTNLLHKSQVMEQAEREMCALAGLWEDKKIPEFKIIYDKAFDIKSTNEQIQELASLFKEDMGSPAANMELIERVYFKMLGVVNDEMKDKIRQDLQYAIDPSLSIKDITEMIGTGVLDPIKMAKKYNPELRPKKDPEILEWISKNKEQLRGVQPAFGEPQSEE